MKYTKNTEYLDKSQNFTEDDNKKGLYLEDIVKVLCFLRHLHETSMNATYASTYEQNIRQMADPAI